MTSDITAYLAYAHQGTPNGYKVSITLEELGLPYKVHAIKLMEGEQKSDWFSKINPNGRMPALTDGAYTLFESIACMQYLVDKYDTEHKLSFPHGSVEYYESLSWLAFHTGGIGPNLGSAFYYQTMANARSDYAIGRFMNETRRLFSLLDKRLATRQWLVGDKYSIVDIAHCSWVRGHYMVKIDLDEYPNLKAWCSKIETREAVKRGIEAIPGRSREESEKRFDEMRAKVYAMENTDKR